MAMTLSENVSEKELVHTQLRGICIGERFFCSGCLLSFFLSSLSNNVFYCGGFPMSAGSHFSITETARLLGVPVTVVNNGFYRGVFDRERCLKMGGRCLVPREYIDAVVIPTLRRF